MFRPAPLTRNALPRAAGDVGGPLRVHTTQTLERMSAALLRRKTLRPRRAGEAETDRQLIAVQLVDAVRGVARFGPFDELEIDPRRLGGCIDGQYAFVIRLRRFGSKAIAVDEDSRGGYRSGRHVGAVDLQRDEAPFDLEFVEGPEAGNSSYGIYQLHGDQLTICLGLTGAPRPKSFSTKKGSGHALERLRRVDAKRPAHVTGGARERVASERSGAEHGAEPHVMFDAKSFDVAMTPLLEKLQGEGAAVGLVTAGEPMRSDWLAFGSRTTTGNEMKVVFGGQVMAHARMKFDERASPIAVDYLNLSGGAKGRVSLGIFEWIGDDARFLIAGPGQPRPKGFDASGKGLTLSRWKRKAPFCP